MIRNYFKIAWRNLFRNKGFSATNLLGLTIGITCTILISLWVKDELTYDKFHANYSSIYKIYANRDFNNQVFTDRSMAMPLASALESSSPQIKHAVMTTYQQQNVLGYNNNKIKMVQAIPMDKPRMFVIENPLFLKRFRQAVLK